MPADGPPELWAYVLSNLLLLGIGSVLTMLSVLAYRRMDRRALLGAAVGFGVVTIGSLVEAIYELGIRGSYELSGRELLALHTVEGVLIAAGLGVLFLSVRRY